MKTSHLEMKTEPLQHGVLVEAHAHGTLDGYDYDSLLPELDALLARSPSVSFLLFLEDFHGWDIESAARELKWDTRNRDRLRKIAVVGDATWEKLSVTLSEWFLPGNVRYFSAAEADEARAWVRAAQ